MSNITQEYAKNLGVKIGEPIFQEHYFPVTYDKYIVVFNDFKQDAKKYDFLDEVLFIIKPVLSSLGYKIINICEDQFEYMRLIDKMVQGLDYKQNSYIIKNSSLFLGVDSVYTHLAAHFKVPTVSLFSNSWSTQTGPVAIKGEYRAIDSPKKNASHSSLERPKTINKIHPEEVAKNVIELLTGNRDVTFKTVYQGAKYPERATQIVPDFFDPSVINPLLLSNVFLRDDYHSDLEIMGHWLSRHKCAIISDNILPLDFLKGLSKNITRYHLNLREDSTHITSKNLHSIQRAGVEIVIDAKFKGDKLRKAREEFFDFMVYEDFADEVDFDLEGKKFLTRKPIFSNGSEYPSKAHWLVDKKSLDKGNEILDNKTFRNELDYFYIYED